jgi:N-acetylglucosamine repressor
MIENERKILSVLAHRGAMTKREIASVLGISWSTVVKITKRLEESGYISFVGRPERKNIQGIDSAVYDLASEKPAAVGIDVGYEKTKIVVSNLRNEVLYEKDIQNPSFEDEDTLSVFLENCLHAVLSDNENRFEIQGIGVGIPAFLLPKAKDIYLHVNSHLSSIFKLPICVDRNIRGYALFKLFESGVSRDLITVTIRTGVGLGIIINGVLYRGESNMAGEISHLAIQGLTGLCRCGQHGCLETGLSHSILEEDYRVLAGQSGRPVDIPDPVAELMSLASSGDSRALEVLRKRSHILAQALMPLFLILNVSQIRVAGHFGEKGSVFTDLVNESLSSMLSLQIGHGICYEELGLLDFAVGASHLVLNGYYC